MPYFDQEHTYYENWKPLKYTSTVLAVSIVDALGSGRQEYPVIDKIGQGSGKEWLVLWMQLNFSSLPSSQTPSPFIQKTLQSPARILQATPHSIRLGYYLTIEFYLFPIFLSAEKAWERLESMSFCWVMDRFLYWLVISVEEQSRDDNKRFDWNSFFAPSGA